MLTGARALYSRHFPGYLVRLLQFSGYNPADFLMAFWQTNDLRHATHDVAYMPTTASRRLLLLTRLLIVAQIVVGVYLAARGLWGDFTGGVLFGTALIIGYPVITAYVLSLAVLLAWALRVLLSPRIYGKKFLCELLEDQVVRLHAAHSFRIVAVVGSVGKTSTKLAIAHTLAAGQQVQFQEGNYNDRLTVPLVVFGHALPNLLNVGAWMRILLANERIIRRGISFDVAVLELGTDGPGQIADFAYLKPDITVVTAVTPEHMEFFKTLDAVAIEELTVTQFSEQVLVNIDDTPPEYLAGKTVATYGLADTAEYRITSLTSKKLDGVTFKLRLGDKVEAFTSPMLGTAGTKISSAAASVAHLLGMKPAAINKALAALPPTPGRMQILKGEKGSTLIDDTYNASPAAVEAGLDVLAETKAPQRIAILGSMNELGDFSKTAHQGVGAYCWPSTVDLIVTIGAEAEQYLAPAARKNGCEVKSFRSPYDAGRYVHEQLKKGAVVLGEGSQNGVFAEEALKQLLADFADSSKFVRQSSGWLNIKKRQFPQQ
ncbi:MAG: UDP-N-acetylmuramoyl-tripeptide--D-alanyl-D-alanine ligase [Candidatus Saccharimonadales bacterium]